MPRQLDHHDLEPQAEPEVRHLVLAGVAARPGSCPRRRDSRSRPGTTMPSRCRRLRLRIVALLEQLRVDPLDAGPHVVVPGGVVERLADADVGVFEPDVLADDADPDLGRGRLRPRDDVAPLAEVGLAGRRGRAARRRSRRGRPLRGPAAPRRSTRPSPAGSPPGGRRRRTARSCPSARPAPGSRSAPRSRRGGYRCPAAP